jgi:hypothetical protein
MIATGSTASAGDTITVALAGATPLVYTCVSGDVGGIFSGTERDNLMNFLNAQPTFNALYVAQHNYAPGWSGLNFIALAGANSIIPMTISYTGAGSLKFNLVGYGTLAGSFANPATGYLTGGDGGASIDLQSTGGAVSPNTGVTQPTVGGFVTQVGNTYTMGGVG